MNIIVTGASAGIGYQLVKIFVADPRVKAVLAIARRQDHLQELQATCNSEKLHTLSFDLAQKDHTPILAASFLKGHQKVDLLINNAGLLINKPFAELTDQDFESSYNVNLFAPVRLIRTILPNLTKASNPHILNISSMGGFQGSAKFAGLSAYSSSKGALSCFTECLAEDLKDQGIKTNCLALGAVQTEMLQQAFPGYQAPTTPVQMATYVAEFGLTGHHYFNGKVLPVSLSTP